MSDEETNVKEMTESYNQLVEKYNKWKVYRILFIIMGFLSIILSIMLIKKVLPPLPDIIGVSLSLLPFLLCFRFVILAQSRKNTIYDELKKMRMQYGGAAAIQNAFDEGEYYSRSHIHTEDLKTNKGEFFSLPDHFIENWHDEYGNDHIFGKINDHPFEFSDLQLTEEAGSPSHATVLIFSGQIYKLSCNMKNFNYKELKIYNYIPGFVFRSNNSKLLSTGNDEFDQKFQVCVKDVSREELQQIAEKFTEEVMETLYRLSELCYGNMSILFKDGNMYLLDNSKKDMFEENISHSNSGDFSTEYLSSVNKDITHVKEILESMTKLC